MTNQDRSPPPQIDDTLRHQAFHLLWFAFLLQGWGTAAPASELYHHIDRATAFEAQNKPREALIEWKNALRYEPDNLDARLSLAKLYIVLGDGERAERELRRASSLGAQANRVIAPLTKALLMQGSYNQLIAELQPEDERYSPTRISPINRAKLLTARGHALTALDRLDEAREAFTASIETGQQKLDARLGLAFIALREEQLQPALQLCEESLKEAPNHLETQLLQAELYRRLRRFEAAAKRFEQILRKHPRQRGALIGLARTRIAQHHYGAAGKALKRFARFYPLDPEQQYLSAIVAFRQGRYPDADALLTNTLNYYPKHHRALMLSATTSYLLGHREQAQRQVGSILSRDPNNETARRLQSLIAMKQGNLDQIAPLLQPSIDSAPGDPWPVAMTARAALLNGQGRLGEQTIRTFLDGSDSDDQDLRAVQRALADEQIDAALAHLDQYLTRPITQRGAQRITNALRYLKQGQWTKAEAESDRLLDLAPGEPIAHHIAALVNLGKGYSDEAKASLEYAIRLRPHFIPSLVSLGRLYLAKQDFDMAMKAAQALRKGAPNEPMGFALVGDIHLAQGDRLQAIDAYRKALNKAGTRLAVRNLSRRLVGLGQPGLVIDKLADWVEGHPNDMDLRIFLALQLQVTNHPNMAMSHYREALKQDPKQLVALNELAVWQQRQGNTNAAADFAEQAYALSPSNPVIMDTLGWIRLSLEGPTEAEPLLGTAMDKLQGAPVAHYHYGVLMAKLKKYAQARTELELALTDVKPTYWSGDARRWLRKPEIQATKSADDSHDGKNDAPASLQVAN